MIKNVESTTIYCGIDISKYSFDYRFVNRKKQILCQSSLPIDFHSLDQLKKISYEVNKISAVWI